MGKESDATMVIQKIGKRATQRWWPRRERDRFDRSVGVRVDGW